METKLERITQLSREKSDMVFTSIVHLINMEMLKECHEKMDKGKAVGIDGVTKVAEEKCRLIEFGRFAAENRKHRGEGKLETFDFLEFTHVCSVNGNGKFKVRRITSRKKFSKKCKELHSKIGQMRTLKTKDIIKWLNQVLIGYYHYYGVYGNYQRVIGFRWNVLKSLFYWLNRRSQSRSYNWKGFLDMIDYRHPIVRPKSFYVLI